MRHFQNCIPVAYTYEAVSVLKTTNMTGVQIISRAPLTFVGATYLGGLVCGYFASIAGNKTLGAIFNTLNYILTRPM